MRKSIIFLLLALYAMINGCSNPIQSVRETPVIQIENDSISGYEQLDSLFSVSPTFSNFYYLNASDSNFVRNPAFVWPIGYNSTDSIAYTAQGLVAPGSVTTINSPLTSLRYVWTDLHCAGCPTMGSLLLYGGQTPHSYCFYIATAGQPLMIATDRVRPYEYPYSADSLPQLYFSGIHAYVDGYIVYLSNTRYPENVRAYAYVDVKSGKIGGFYKRNYVEHPNFIYGTLKK